MNTTTRLSAATLLTRPVLGAAFGVAAEAAVSVAFHHHLHAFPAGRFSCDFLN